MVAAAYFALTATRGPEEAILRAVNLGGSAPVLGALTGALAGAIWGLGAFSASWTDLVWNRSEILRLAEELGRGRTDGSLAGCVRSMEEAAERRSREEREAVRREILDRCREGRGGVSETSTA